MNLSSVKWTQVWGQTYDCETICWLDESTNTSFYKYVKSGNYVNKGENQKSSNIALKNHFKIHIFLLYFRILHIKE